MKRLQFPPATMGTIEVCWRGGVREVPVFDTFDADGQEWALVMDFDLIKPGEPDEVENCGEFCAIHIASGGNSGHWGDPGYVISKTRNLVERHPMTREQMGAKVEKAGYPTVRGTILPLPNKEGMK